MQNNFFILPLHPNYNYVEKNLGLTGFDSG